MDRAQIRRHSRALVAAAVAGLALAVTACGGSDDDAGADDQAAVDSREAVETDTTAGGRDSSGDARSRVNESAGGSGPGSELNRSQSDAASDLERQVSETLSDLDAEVRDGDTVVTLPEQVLFEFDQHVLLPEAAATLDRIAEAIIYFEDAPVQVAGHTDSRGSTEYNQGLSERRARSVVDHLVGAGVEASLITAQGFGETQPIAPNENEDGADNPGGRAQNRRVEIVIEGVDPADLDSGGEGPRPRSIHHP